MHLPTPSRYITLTNNIPHFIRFSYVTCNKWKGGVPVIGLYCIAPTYFLTEISTLPERANGHVLSIVY